MVKDIFSGQEMDHIYRNRKEVVPYLLRLFFNSVSHSLKKKNKTENFCPDSVEEYDRI